MSSYIRRPSQPGDTPQLYTAVPMAPKKREMQQKWLSDMQNELHESKKREIEAGRKCEYHKSEVERLGLALNDSIEKTKQLQSRLYDTTKNVKVTDDDFSTIIAKLGKFSGKLSNFPPNSKSSFKKELSQDQIIEFFTGHFKPEEKQHIQFLFHHLDNDDNKKLDYALVAVLVEKLITQEIVNKIYRAPIHLDPIANQAFEKIHQLFKTSDHPDWIKDLRLKMSKATFDLINARDQETCDINAKTRQDLIDSLVSKLVVIYKNPEDIRSRIEKLVDMAIELSLPIRGQEDLVEIYELKDTDVPLNNQVKPLYRHLGKDKIVLGVTPVFLAQSTVEDEYNGNDDEEEEKEEEEEGEDITSSYIPNYTLVYQGKAIW